VLVLEGECDLVGGDGAFAENHPGVASAGEVDDGGGGGAGGGAAVDDEGQLVAELLADAGGRGALGQAEQVGRGCGDGQAEAGDDGAWDGGFGHAQGEVAGVGGDAQGKAGAGFDDDGERAGPELFGETIEGGVELAGEFVGLGDFGDEEGEGLVASAGFELVDAIDGAEIDGVDGETVEGVGGERDDVAAAEAVGDVGDESGFGLVGMDAESFGRQCGLLSGGALPPKYLRKVFHRWDLGRDSDARRDSFRCKVFQAKTLTLRVEGLFWFSPSF
jgi:hypothetical protein